MYVGGGRKGYSKTVEKFNELKKLLLKVSISTII